MTDDRRRDERQPIRAEAEIRFASWDVFRLIFTINISKGGMSLELTEEVKVGSTLFIKLALPTGPPIEIQSLVKHVTPSPIKGQIAGGAPMMRYYVGVEFKDIAKETLEQLERLLQKNLSQGGGRRP